MYADDISITLGGEDAYQLLEHLRNELQDVLFTCHRLSRDGGPQEYWENRNFLH